jgi:hypothetical protein
MVPGLDAALDFLSGQDVLFHIVAIEQIGFAQAHKPNSFATWSAVRSGPIMPAPP